MFRSAFDRFKTIDPYLSLGSYALSAFSFLGITAGTVMAALLYQLNWFWDAFQWAGVLFGGLVAWLLVGIGTNLFHLSTKEREGRLNPFLIVAAIAAIVLLGSLGAYAFNAAPGRGFSGSSNTKLEIVTGKFFKNERVPLDGKHYVNCKFENVTLVYNGGPFNLDHNNIGNFQIATDRDEISNYVKMLNELGLLKIPAFMPDGTIAVPSNPVPLERYIQK